MNVATVLQFLTSELARHGAEIISAADLAALGAVERRLVDARLADVDAARTIAGSPRSLPMPTVTPFETRSESRLSHCSMPSSPCTR